MAAVLPIDSARQINTANIGSGANNGLAWTPDGRIVYVSEESGNADIWTMNADGSDRKQLTTDPHRDATPVVSPDGRYIAFAAERDGAEAIWVMNIDGSNQRRLTNKFIERAPAFSADSNWVYFVSWRSGKGTIWRTPVDGGEPAQVISDLSFDPALSPDGKWLAYVAQGKILIAPAEGGQPIKSFDARGNHYQWTPDGRGLTFLCNSCQPPPSRPSWANLWVQPLDGGAPQQLTNFATSGGLSDGKLFNYAWSHDGKQLATASVSLPSDLVLINDLR